MGHEDLDANIITTAGSSTSTTSLFSGTTDAKMHHVNIHNADTTNTVTVIVYVAEGTSGNDVTLRMKDLAPGDFVRVANGLGDDDTLYLKVVNDAESSVDVHASWW